MEEEASSIPSLGQPDAVGEDALAPPARDEGSGDDPSEFVKPNKAGLQKGDMTEEYILGTLIVRVVAARNLEPVRKGGLGLGRLGGSSGKANPYASVKFGRSNQRSSEVFDTLDPIWPRQETMFMDVALGAREKIAHPEVMSPSSDAPAASLPPPQAEYEKPSTVMTVALFHTPEPGKAHKYPSKGGLQLSGDSDDLFLGMASVDLGRLLTGNKHTIDTWLRLTGTETSRGSVRVVCEYESSEPVPRPGDYCRFTRYCNPRDLYPIEIGRQYRVSEVDGDFVIISYSTQENWVCSFQAHRYMLHCEERHSNATEIAQDELQSLAERLVHSPLLSTITDTAEKVAVEGLIGVGEEMVKGGMTLFNRWFSGGVDTIVGDVTHATNWDGRFNPDHAEGLGIPEVESSESEAGDEFFDPMETSTSDVAIALPNMPCCPITGEPMAEPVVAADGHTYERSAISRWFSTSNKSPMTGAVLTHKELVTNFGLLSSVQESAQAASTTNMQSEKDVPQEQDTEDVSDEEPPTSSC